MSATAAETRTLSRTARRLTLVAMSLGFAVVQLDVSVVNVAVHSIGTDLGGRVSDLQWVLNAYTITFAAFIITAGALGDRIGARRVFVAGFGLFMVTSAVCGLAPSLAVLVAARAIQGVAAATLVPSSLTLLNHTYTEPAERSRAVGLWMFGSSLTFGGGPVVGGALIALFDWRAIFFINIPLAIAGIALALTCTTETTTSRERAIDAPGQVLAVVTLAALVGATIEGGVHGFASTTALIGYGVAVAALVAFIVTETRSHDPMLPLSLFRSRQFSVPSAIGLLINLAIFGLLFELALFFQEVQHRSPLMTGTLLVPYVVGGGSGNALAHSLSRRIGPARTLMISAGLLAGGCAGILGLGPHTPYVDIVGQLFAMGIGLGTIMPTITSALMGAVERGRSGIAAGTLNTMRQTGSAIGVALFGALLSASSGFVAGMHLSLVIAAGICAGVVLISPLIRGRMRSDLVRPD